MFLKASDQEKWAFLLRTRRLADLRETSPLATCRSTHLQQLALVHPMLRKEAARERPNRQPSDSSRARSRMLIPSSTTSSDAVSGTSTRSTFP